MSDYISCQSQPIPAYSGITININNPVMSAPCSENCRAKIIKPAANRASDNSSFVQNQVYTSSPTEGISPNGYYSQAEIRQNYENAKTQNAYSENKTSEQSTITDKTTDENPIINNYINMPQEKLSGESGEKDSENKNNADVVYVLDRSETPIPHNTEDTGIKKQNENTENAESVPSSNVNNKTSSKIIEELDIKNAEQKDLEENGKKTKVVALTNEYIMSLENYLNNPNTDIRLMASKEILMRLDEDRSRYDDAALNALLNKMLQDPSKLIRIAALSALSSDLASGNDYTIQLLNHIQQDPNSDKQDVLDAAQILLNRSATTEIRYIRQNNNEQAEE